MTVWSIGNRQSRQLTAPKRELTVWSLYLYEYSVEAQGAPLVRNLACVIRHYVYSAGISQ
jgi:hypothetical protein